MQTRVLVITASLASLFVISIAPGLAQQQQTRNALNSTAAYGTQGGWGHSSFRGTESVWDYEHKNAPEQFELAPQGWADYTNTQGAASPNGPLLYGTPSTASGPNGQSGAASSSPFQGTYAAPGNFALRNEGRQTLPPTRLTSIIRDGGMNDHAYGDEGTSGPPPYSSFTTIEGTGGVSSLTTGHPSDAPSAWGYPQ